MASDTVTEVPPFSSPLYPFARHRFPVGAGGAGPMLHYVDEGSGEPIVLVHGNPTWSFFFRDLIRPLSRAYRCVAPDHIGCGLSDKPGAASYPYTFDRRARDLEALLDSLGLVENLTLVLHDWGGMIGMLFASRFPERIKRLILLNTGAFHLPPTKPLPMSLRLVRDTPLGPFLVRGLNAFSTGAARSCAIKPLSAEARRGYLAPYDSWANRVAVLEFVRTIPLRPTDPGYDLVTEVQEGLHRFRDVPTLLAWGMRDFVFDRHFLEAWEGFLPGAEVHRFEDAGHYVLDDAGERIVPLVESFLAAHPIAGPPR